MRTPPLLAPLWFAAYHAVLSLVVLFALLMSFCGCAAVEPYDRIGGGVRVVLPAGVIGDYFSMRAEFWVGFERRAERDEQKSDAFAFPIE